MPPAGDRGSSSSNPPASSSTRPVALRNPALQPYWSPAVESWSRRLWLPAAADAVASTELRSTWFTRRTTHQPPRENQLRISTTSTSRPGTANTDKESEDKRRERSEQVYALRGGKESDESYSYPGISQRKAEDDAEAMAGLRKVRDISPHGFAFCRNAYLALSIPLPPPTRRKVYNMVVEDYRAGNRTTNLSRF